MPQKKYPLSKKNQNEIQQFLNSLKADGSPDDDTIRNYETSIRRVLSTIGKDKREITASDLDRIFSSITNPGTKELVKMKFKAYLRYWKMSKLAEHIKIDSAYFKKARKTANDVLTKEEIEQIRNSNNSLRDLAIFELFTTSGICREELSLLLNQNITIAEDEIRVEIAEGKTPNRPRNIRIIPYPNNPCAFYPNHFVDYFRNHQFKNKKDFPLFFSTDFRKPNQPFECHALNQIIHKVSKKAGISKNVTPHILRHTCATHDGYQNNEGFLQTKFGWKNPDMARTYCHLREEQVYDTLKHKAGLSPQYVESESKCVYCGQTNNINDLICNNCKRIINKEEMARQLKAQDERESKIKEGFEQQINNLRYELQANELLTSFFHQNLHLRIRVVSAVDGKKAEVLKEPDYEAWNKKFLENASKHYDNNAIDCFKDKLHKFNIKI